ncbi:hypothetical protein Pcinc_040534 [Petrolisthes cinctipes]|uniref:Uncharacterized protein n=1 Tax=Petrolisthes cinctipes TaxID=88211 RepID=A0AAE1BLP5_PETCI|nr:hypothetical protein Pcinc_040534 [Petrolisthes cinctipes]
MERSYAHRATTGSRGRPPGTHQRLLQEQRKMRLGLKPYNLEVEVNSLNQHPPKRSKDEVVKSHGYSATHTHVPDLINAGNESDDSEEDSHGEVEVYFIV